LVREEWTTPGGSASIRRLIAQLTAAQNKKLDISVERTLAQIARHAYVDPRALFNDDGTLKKISELDADTAACIAGVQMGTGRNGKRVESIKITNQLRALEMLGNYLKLFAEDRNPVDLGVKVIIMDAPRPHRPVASAASMQLPLPETRST
jgi:Terminase small subunit